MQMNVQHVLHTFVVDMMKHLGDSQGLISSVNRYVASHFPGAKVAWYARPDQEYLLHNSNVRIDRSYDNSEASAFNIREWILEMSRDGHAGSIFHVFSYDSGVLDAANSLNQLAIVVIPSHMNFLRRAGNWGTTAIRNQPLIQQPIQGPLSADEAISLAQRVLRRGGHTSVQTGLRKTRLRPAMISLDPRARKNFADPLSVRLVSFVVEDGLTKGWLEQHWDGKEGDEVIWLKNEGEMNSTPVISSLTVTNHPSVVRPIESIADGVDTDTSYSTGVDASFVEPSPEVISALTENAAPPAQTVKASEPQTNVDEAKDAAPKKEYRSDLMERVLRNRRIGSPAIPRKHLFDAVEEILKEDSDVQWTVVKLTDEARERAIKAAEKGGYTRPQNWYAISGCFMRMMVAAGALIKSDGTPISPGLKTASTVVKEPAPAFRDRCEAFLVEYIIKEMGDVTVEDDYQLGLCLFQQGGQDPKPRSEMVGRVSFLLGLLEEEERIEEVEGRIVTKSK